MATVEEAVKQVKRAIGDVACDGSTIPAAYQAVDDLVAGVPLMLDEAVTAARRERDILLAEALVRCQDAHYNVKVVDLLTYINVHRPDKPLAATIQASLAAAQELASDVGRMYDLTEKGYEP